MVVLLIDSLEEFPKASSFMDSKILNCIVVPEGEELVKRHIPISENEEIIIDNIEELDYLKEGEEPYIFSYNPKKIEDFIISYGIGKPFYSMCTESEFKSAYSEFKEDNADIMLPKLMISSGRDIDLLDLADLFKVTDSRTLKYINGSKDSTPILIPYEGLSTFEKINNFKSGVLVPARDMDIQNLNSKGYSLNKNITYIIQYIVGGDYIDCFSYSVKTNPNYGLVWTDVEKINQSPIKSIHGSLINLDLSKKITNLTFYMELEKHKDSFYVSKIHQGIHPFYSFDGL